MALARKSPRAYGERPLIGITMGDPSGIGPEVIAKGLAGPAVHRMCRPLVIGSPEVLAETVRSLGLPLTVRVVRDHEGSVGLRREITVLDPLPRPLGRFRMGVASAKTGNASVEYITKAVRLAEFGCIDAMVTAPINKKAINLAGHAYPGHTELLADLTRSKAVGMMILGGPLKIMFVTTHLSLRDLPDALTRTRIVQSIHLADRAMRELFSVPRPRIGVAALNPHAGESGLFGDEEKRTILPAARKARAAGIRNSDPLPADTLFGKAARGDFDAVVAMYHDQGLIPLKLVAFGRCVNLTVGIPIIRTSVDHGTAYDIAGKGAADPGSLIEAVTLATTLALSKRRKTSVVGQARA